MTKTICDICGKEIATSIIAEPIRNYNFCISSYGKSWDLCNECREEINKWIKQRKNKSMELTEDEVNNLLSDLQKGDDEE